MMRAEPPARAGRREWLGLGLLTLPLFVLSLDVSVLFLAAPSLSADLGPSATELIWILDVYGFVIAGLLVTMGTLGDRIGSRRLLLIGALAFAAASLLAAYSTSPGMLIAARALLGAAGATLMPSTLALITTMFRDDAQRGLAVGIWMTTFSVGIALGPMVGGALLELFWWGSVFLPGVPVMLALVVLAPRTLPERRDPDPGRLDPLSVVLSLTALLAIVYGLKEIAAYGASAPAVIAMGSGALAGAVFVRRQRRLAHPLLDLGLLAERAVAVPLALLLVGIAAVNGVQVLYPQFLQSVEGFSPLGAGLWTVPLAAAAIVGSLLASPLAQRTSQRAVMTGGALIAAGGFLLLTQVSAGAGLAWAVAGAATVVFGLSPLGVLGTGAVVNAANPDRAGAAAAMSETSGELGVGLGAAAGGTIATAIYRATFDPPATVASEPRAQAEDGITAAVEVSDTLPEVQASALLDAARDAFTEGVTVVGGAGVALALILAVIAVRGIVPRRRTGEARETT